MAELTTSAEVIQALADASLAEIETHETHRVHPQAVSAIMRARKPIEPPT